VGGSLWADITDWMHKPFKQEQDVANWLLLLILSSTIAYAWSRILDNVLEE
jgi:hypothetical protein